MFNNKYYKLLAGHPGRVYDSCTGTLDDKDAPVILNAMPNLKLKKVWKHQDPWSSANKTGHLRWDINYLRGPDCGPTNSFGRKWDTLIHEWGKKDLFDKCCTDKMACYNDDSEVKFDDYSL